MATDRIYAGVLEGIREIVPGYRMVVIRRQGGEVLVSPLQFPSEEWIDDHVGQWVHVILEKGEVKEVKLGVDPNSIMNITLVADKDQVAVTCHLCHKVVCCAPRPDKLSPEQVKRAMRPFIEHLDKEHPYEAEEIRKSIE